MEALTNLEELRILSANNTSINSLQPLQKLRKLVSVYCDHTAVDKSIADAFMAINSGVLVVFNSADLKTWWNLLSPEAQYGLILKTVFHNKEPVSSGSIGLPV